MQDLQVFTNERFGKVRILEENGKVLFCAKDIAKTLGYKDTTNAVKQHCKGVAKRHLLTDGGKQEVNFIPEGDVYRLIVNSRLPAAEEFERWVFDEVLPSIAHKGYYASTEKLEALRDAIDMLDWCQRKLRVERACLEFYASTAAADLRRYRRDRALRDAKAEDVQRYERVAEAFVRKIAAMRDVLPQKQIGGGAE